MERKVLAFDPHLCTGCMYCITACSTHNEGRTSLSAARLRMIRHEGHALTRAREKDELIFTLVMCRQCEDPVCSAVCPTGAITRDSSIGAMVIEREVCTGCGECTTSCPFGAISFSENSNGEARAFKCELCKGDPLCVKFCYAQALTYVPARDVTDPERPETAVNGVAPLAEKGAVIPDRGKQQ
ncbi:MAG: 4Fe-4S dicluster domain-containing protein [Syntrophorhabdales bacterium]|jgi:Fe-S-cluster-containing dehydrogenase component